jgi:geranylgeranyl diphosphate synthase, type I
VSAIADDPLSALRPRVQQVLDDFLAEQREALAQIGPELMPLVDIGGDLLHGGKRLRPAFCYWGWRGAGGPDAAPIVTVAAALELFQAAALVHDDVIDGSDTRRGLPSAHRRFEALHAGSVWRGDQVQFGVASAILLGDLLFGWSDELLSSAGLDDTALRRARQIYDRMRTEVGGGQFLDVLAQVIRTARPDELADRARRVMLYKAARYSVERPLLLGGAAAGASEALLTAYSAYGLALGEAFQLRDDVLGVFGDPDQTGKPAGDDLREGKQTLLIAYALEGTDDRARATVRRLLGDPELDQAGVDRLRDVIVGTGALGRVEAVVTDLVATARSALAAAPVDQSARAALDALIDAATARTG